MSADTGGISDTFGRAAVNNRDNPNQKWNAIYELGPDKREE